MSIKKLSELTDEELLIEKKNIKKDKLFNAFVIGFLFGILVFGVSYSIINKKPIGLLPTLLPIFLIYKFRKNVKDYSELKEILKQRNLD